MLFFLLSAAAWLITSPADDEPCAKMGGLRSWLCSMSFDIPDQHISAGGADIRLTAMRCGHMLLGEVSSSVKLPPANATFALGVQGFGLNCTIGGFHFKYGLFSGTGSATVEVGQATLDTGIELVLEQRETSPRHISPITPRGTSTVSLPSWRMGTSLTARLLSAGCRS